MRYRVHAGDVIPFAGDDRIRLPERIVARRQRIEERGLQSSAGSLDEDHDRVHCGRS